MPKMEETIDEKKEISFLREREATTTDGKRFLKNKREKEDKEKQEAKNERTFYCA